MESRYTKYWSDYNIDYGYDKFEYDIILHTGQIVFNCYPNGGTFISCDAKSRYKHFSEEDVLQIRLSGFPLLGINPPQP